MDTFTIADLRKDEVAQQFNPCSTLYVPPLTASTPITAELAQRVLGASSIASRQTLFPANKWRGEPAAVPAYSARERAAVAALAGLRAEQRPLAASDAMRKAMADLSLSPALLKRYKADPPAFAHAVEGLTDLERAALSLGTPGPIFGAMKMPAGVTEENIKDSPVVPASYVVIVATPVA